MRTRTGLPSRDTAEGHLAESMERIRGKGKARIDYRHIIGSLVRKPGAFARYRFREQLYPTHTFRLAYDAPLSLTPHKLTGLRSKYNIQV